MRVEDFLDRLKSYDSAGHQQWTAPCPAHDDASPSLSVGVGPDGKILLKCHAGCEAPEIVGALGLEMKHLFAEHEAPITVEELAVDKGLLPAFLRELFALRDDDGAVIIPYFDASGTLIAEKRRTALSARKGSRWPYGVPLALYGLWALGWRSFAQRWALLVEGESDVWTAWAHGLAALGVPGAATAKKTVTAEVLSHLDRLYIVQEPDSAGAKFVVQIAEAISTAGWPGAASVVRLPGAKDLNELHKADPAQFVTRLNRALGSATPLGDAALSATEAASDWPVPQPLAEEEIPLPTFDAEVLLPASIRRWVTDTSERMGAPVEYAAVAAIIAIGATIGRQLAIRPKANDIWTVIANLWGAVIGEPGTLKSPPIKEMLVPLHCIEAKARSELQGSDAAFGSLVARTRRLELEAKVREKVKNGENPEPLAAEYAAIKDPLASAKRYVVNDITAEKLAEVLSTNPNGVLLFRDELAGFFKALTRKGREGERQFLLEAWGGDQPFSSDRISRGLTNVQAACVSVFGTIQPGPFRHEIRGVISNGSDNDGLIQRFQLLVEVTGERVYEFVDRQPDEGARSTAFALFDRLEQINAAEFGAAVDGNSPPYLRFAPDAQAVFSSWLQDLMSGHKEGDPAFIAHLSKYRKLVPALALILHVADVAARLRAPGPVSLDAIERALRWEQFLRLHARRIYAREVRSTSPTRMLAERIRLGDAGDGFTSRDIERKHWSGLRDRTAVRRALTELTELGWLRRERKGIGGQQTETFTVNPRLFDDEG